MRNLHRRCLSPNLLNLLLSLPERQDSTGCFCLPYLLLCCRKLQRSQVPQLRPLAVRQPWRQRSRRLPQPQSFRRLLQPLWSEQAMRQRRRLNTKARDERRRLLNRTLRQDSELALLDLLHKLPDAPARHLLTQRPHPPGPAIPGRSERTFQCCLAASSGSNSHSHTERFSCTTSASSDAPAVSAMRSP